MPLDFSKVDDDFYDSLQESSANNVRSNFSEALKVNPDEQAKVADLSQKSGVPEFAVQSDPDEIERNLKLDSIDWSEFSQRRPNTAKYLTDFKNARIAHDDVDVLGSIEDGLKATGNFITGAAGAQQRGFEHVFDAKHRGDATLEKADIERQAANAVLNIGEPITDQQVDRLKELDDLMSQGSDDFGFLAGIPVTAAEQLPLMLRVAGTALGYAAVGGAAGAGVGAAVGAVTGPGAIPTAIAFAALPAKVGANVGVAKEVFGIEYGLAYSEFRVLKDDNDRIMDPTIAAKAAMVVGAVNASMEFLSFKILGRTVTPAMRIMIRSKVKQSLGTETGKELLTRLTRRYIETVATEGVTEGFQELSNVVGGEIAKHIDKDSFTEQDFSKAWDNIAASGPRIAESFVAGVQANIVYGGLGTATTAIVEQRRREKLTEDDQLRIDTLNANVGGSKLKERSPEAFRQFVEQADGDNNSTVFIDGAQTSLYLQGKTPEEIEADPALMRLSKAATEAALLGSDIQMSVADFATDIAGSDHYDALRPSMTMDPEATSPFREPKVKQEGEAYIQSIMAGVDKTSTEYAEAQKIYESVRDQLFDTGKLNKKSAKISAQIVPAVMTSYAKRVGVTVAEAYQTHGFTIQGPQTGEAERLAGEQVLTQARASGFDLSFTDESNEIREVKVGDATIVLDARPDQIKISSVRVPQKKRNKGSARKAMTELISQADSEGVTLSLDASALDKKTSTEKLVTFYESLGFVKTGNTVNSLGEPEMVRAPDPDFQGSPDLLAQGPVETPDEHIQPETVIPPHEVRDESKVSALSESMKKNGWVGRPVLVFDTGNAGKFALTGTHRIAAATEAGIDVPVVYVDEEKFNEQAGKDDVTFDQIIGSGDDQVESFLRSSGDNRSADLMDLEIDSPGLLAQGPVTEQIDTDEFKKWSEGGEVVEPEDVNNHIFKADTPVVLKVFHGTTHKFNVFDATRGNIGSQFGAVNYFTSSQQDARDNYAGEGPDLTNRIEQRAELLENEIQEFIDENSLEDAIDEYGISKEDFVEDASDIAFRFARAELSGGEDQTLELFVKVKNPFVIGENAEWIEFVDNESIQNDAISDVASNNGITEDEVRDNIEYEDQLDEARWEIENNTPNRLIETIQKVSDRHGVDASNLAGDVYNLGSEALPKHIEDLLRISDDYVYAEDPETGTLIQSKMIGEVIEELGFDSIILRNADDRFSNMDIESDTTHVHIFDSGKTNIKSVENQGTFDPADPNIFKQETRGYYDPANSIIRLTESADLSTFLHEFAHFMYEMEKKGDTGLLKEINSWFKRNAKAVAKEANSFLGKKFDVLKQSAFHGTPHKFDKFTLDHIGSGEGAQAFGWGLYFAESKDVAEFYRDKLERPEGAYKGQPISEIENQHLSNGLKKFYQERVLNGNFVNASRNNALKEMDRNVERIEKSMAGGTDQVIELFQRELDSIDEARIVIKNLDENEVTAINKGTLARVTLKPEPDEWLLWDKPLSEQSEKVREILRGVDVVPKTYTKETLPERVSVVGGGEIITEDDGYVLKVNKAEFKINWEDVQRLLGKGDGSEIYRGLSDSFGSDKEASLYLQSIGIPGIKYFDGSSRNKGEGNSNFVVFDDSLIQIEEFFEQTPTPPQGQEGSITEEDVNRFLDDTTTGDDAKDAAIRRAVHEQFARGFETYLMEGKAPSIELRNAFRTFARWLSRIYLSLRGDLNVNLDDQMRKVFDRLVATEEQIAAAEARANVEPMFTDAAMAGMTEEEFIAYKAQQEKAKDIASETLRDKIIGQLTRQTKRWWKEEKQDVIDEQLETLKTEKVYAARERLKSGDLKLDHATVIQIAGVQKTDKLGRTTTRIPSNMTGMTAKGQQGVHPDEAAAFLGYDSGAQMIDDLTTAPPIGDKAEANAEATMIQRHGDIMNDGTIEREADAAVQNEERGKLILQELKTLARGTNVPTIDRSTMKEIAARNIGRLSFREIHPGKYRRAEIRAAQESARMLAEGNREGAATAKARQAMNFALGAAATEARDETLKIVDRMGRYRKKRVRENIMRSENGYWEQIVKILERFEFRKSATLKDTESLNTWAKERMESDGDGLVLSNAVLNETYVSHWKNVPFSDLQGISDSVKNIEHVARYANKMKVLQEEIDFKKLKANWITSITEQDARFPTKESRSRIDDSRKATAAEHIRRFAAQLTKVPFLASWLDGGKRAGISHDILIQPMTDALDAKIRMLDEVAKPVADAISGRSKADQKRHNTKVWVPEIDDYLMGHQILAVALNTGNQGNLKKMLLGEGWANPENEADITFDNNKLQAVLSHMTKDDWDLVQLIWDQMETLYPQLAEVHRRTTGLTPPKVEATPVVTKFGGYRGGYYSVKYSPKRSHRAEKNAEKRDAETESMFNNTASIQSSVNTGATNERTGFYDRIHLSIEVVMDHFNETIHYITHHDAVRQTNRLIQSPDVASAITGSLGEAEFAQLKPWLNDIAKDGRQQPVKTYIDRAFQRLRFGTTLGVMGFKASTGIMQLFGLLTTAAELGVGPTVKGVYTTVGRSWYMTSARRLFGSTDSLQSGWDFAAERSKVMNHRALTMDREIKSAMDRLHGKSGFLAGVQETSMKHIALIQTYMVDLPTWHAAYSKELSESGDEAKAIRFADLTVENVQGSGATKDMAFILRNQSKIHTTFTMFMTFFSSLGNLTRDVGKGAKSGLYSPTSVAAKLMFMFTLPVFIEMLMRGELDEPDDDDDRLSKFMVQSALYPINSVPFVRDVASGIIGDFGYNSSPVASLLEKGAQGSKAIIEAAVTDKEVTKAAIKNTTKVGAAAAGVPGVNQVWATGEHLYDVIAEGEDLTARELLFGPDR